MSRIIGRMYDVYQISTELNSVRFPKYKKDYRECSWDDIEKTPERIEMYLPEKAIDFLSSKKIKIMRTPFLKYTLTQIPDKEEEDRYIKFPSLLPKIEFKRELMFYIGTLLSSYHGDSPGNIYTIPGEYDDVLPLLLEYLYLKDAGREDEFSLKKLIDLQKFNKTYPMFFDNYQDFQNLRESARFADLSQEKMDKFDQLCVEKDSEIESLTKDSVVLLSSLDGTLSLIDMIGTRDEFKKLIEELMLNESDNRGKVLRERGIDSFGYKRLRKEIKSLKK
jgi:hypothetical protein